MSTISMFARAEFCSGLALALVGCTSLTPVYDEHPGEAVHTVRIIQTLNLNVSMNNDPVNGVDGRAATSVMDRYDTQYRAPQSDASAFTVGVSSGNSLDFMGK